MGHPQLLWTTFQCLTNITGKNFFLISNLNLPLFCLKPLPLVLSLHALVKSPSPAFLKAPFRYWKAVIGLPKAFSSPGWTAPTLSAFPHRRGVPALTTFLWPCSRPTPTAPCLSCVEGSRAGHRSPGGVSPERSKGAEPSPSTCWPRFFWCSHYIVCFLGFEHTLLGLAVLLTSQHPQVLLPRTALTPSSTQFISVRGISPVQVRDLAFGPVELDVRTGPALKRVKVPLDGIPSVQHVDRTT